MRVARALSSRMNRAEVDELLSRMEKEIPKDARSCVHGRQFFEKIAKITPEWTKKTVKSTPQKTAVMAKCDLQLTENFTRQQAIILRNAGFS